MKVNKTYTYSALMSTLMKFYAISDIAKKMAENITSETGVEIDVYNCKSDGFILRKRKEITISLATLIQVFSKTIREMVDEEKDGIVDYLYDIYDVEYKEKDIDNKFATTIVEIVRSGRLITVELDM